jgi:hypothetical protein
MNTTGNGITGGGAGNIKIRNFLEALRNSQGKTSETSPNLGIRNETSIKKEIEQQRVEQFHNQRYQEWNKIYSSKEIEVQKRISTIRQELKKLKTKLKKLDQNIVKAIESPVVETSVYHESHLEHIKNIIHLYSLNVSKTNSWLETYNNRSKKQGQYWGMAKSNGSSFTQSNERSIATSVG